MSTSDQTTATAAASEGAPIDDWRRWNGTRADGPATDWRMGDD